MLFQRRDTTATYEKFKRWYWDLNKLFHPVQFDPGQWAKAAKVEWTGNEAVICNFLIFKYISYEKSKKNTHFFTFCRHDLTCLRE